MLETSEPDELTSFVNPDARLQQFREALVDDSLRSIALLSLCVLGLSFWRNFLGPDELRRPLAFAVVVLSSLMVSTIFLLRRRLSYRFKSVGLLLMLFLAGSGGLIAFGNSVPTGNYFAMGFFIGAILYPRSVVFAMIAGAVALMALVGYSVVSGLQVISVNLNEIARQPAAWINLTITMGLTAGAIATAASAFTRSVHGLLGDLYRQQMEITRQRDQIHHLATHDNLTGLPMLSLADDRGQVAIAQAQRANCKVAFLFVDLDGFKEINDQHGHSAGDAVLKAVGSRLKSSVRVADTAARIGGDEFLLILTQLHDVKSAGDVAGKVVQAVATPVGYDNHVIPVGASVGIAVFPDHGTGLAELKRAADKAMYAAKAAGKNRAMFAVASQDPGVPHAHLGQVTMS